MAACRPPPPVRQDSRDTYRFGLLLVRDLRAAHLDAGQQLLSRRVQGLAAVPLRVHRRGDGHHALRERAAPSTGALRGSAAAQNSDASITLFLFGGVAQIGAEPPSAIAEFLIASAGPLVSLILAILFYTVQPLVVGIEPLLGLAKYLAFINLALALFNLIPGYPLDGGRVFRAIVWATTGNMRRATLIAANAGRFFAFLFIFLGVWQMFSGDFAGGLWIAFIGWFLDNAASAQVQQVMVRGLLAGHTVSQAMSTHCANVPADPTLQDLVDEHILGSGQHCFLVNRGADVVGLMTLQRIKEVPRPQWATTRADQVMLPLEQLKSVDPDTEVWTALQKLDRNGVNQLPVTRDHHVVGMLSREDVISFLRTLQELGMQPT